jgi:hypothetical protein
MDPLVFLRQKRTGIRPFLLLLLFFHPEFICPSMQSFLELYRNSRVFESHALLVGTLTST